MADRPTEREIERSQNMPSSAPDDPSVGLREHVAHSRPRAVRPDTAASFVASDLAAQRIEGRQFRGNVVTPPVPVPYLHHVYDSNGRYVTTYLPHQEAQAREHASTLKGYRAPVPVEDCTGRLR